MNIRKDWLNKAWHNHWYSGNILVESALNRSGTTIDADTGEELLSSTAGGHLCYVYPTKRETLAEDTYKNILIPTPAPDAAPPAQPSPTNQGQPASARGRQSSNQDSN